MINLDRASERRAHMDAQFHRLGVQPIRVPAVDSAELSAAETAHWQSRSQIWKPLTPSQIACFLSHRKVWQLIVEAAEPWAFVCEDDIHLADDFADFVKTWSWCPHEAALIRAETDCLPGQFSFFHRSVFGHRLRRVKSSQLGSAGYFLSLEAAKRLLKFTENCCEPMDCLLFFDRGDKSQPVTAHQIDPALCVQDLRLDLHTRRGFPTQIEMTADMTDPVRPRFPAKIWREIHRPFAQATLLSKRAWLRLTLQSVFKIVPIDLP
ncbi:glycosyltransferase family 25 protein [Mesorhizobium sp. VNQ89]|uniref:glycosyltransferase family 25 protein n=1 Tax=Mesorhizobium quangtriensis TaxID=3157709 RepID=UPI0032B77DFE